MTASTLRLYNCKDEELPVISSFAVFSLKTRPGRIYLFLAEI
jgi:hypothetical protein